MFGYYSKDPSRKPQDGNVMANGKYHANLADSKGYGPTDSNVADRKYSKIDSKVSTYRDSKRLAAWAQTNLC